MEPLYKQLLFESWKPNHPTFVTFDVVNAIFFAAGFMHLGRIRVKLCVLPH